MTIGIDATRAFAQEKTGVEYYSLCLLKELAKTIPESCDVCLYTSEKIPPTTDWIPPHWGNKKLNWPFRYGWTSGRLTWEMMTASPEVLFIPSNILPLWCPPRSLTTLHDIAFEFLPDLYSFQTRSRLKHGLRQALKKAANIMVPSQQVKQTILETQKGIDQNRIRVTPLGYDARRFHNEINATEADAVIKSHHIHRPYLLYVGRLEKKKNIEALIRAFEHVKDGWNDLELVLVGKPGYGYSAIRDVIRSSKNKEAVHELGWVKENELPLLYAKAETTVLISWYEGFGIPVLESMACGTPVVASAVGALPELVGDAGILVNPGDTAEIGVAIVEAITNSSARETMRTQCLNRAKQYSWRRCAETTWDVIKNT